MKKNLFVLFTVILTAVGATAQSKSKVVQAQDCSTDNTKPICNKPRLYTRSAADGYVTASGHWNPLEAGIAPKNSDIEITCIRARVTQVSSSPVGFCLVAMGFTLDAPNKDSFGAGFAMVSTHYLDIVSWGKTRVIAEKNAPLTKCENQQIVIDFPSNAVTLTSTLSFSTERCAKVNKGLSHTMVFSLVHDIGSSADKDANPFLVGE